MSTYARGVFAGIVVLGLAAITCNVPSNVQEPVLSNNEIAQQAAAKVLTAQAVAAPPAALEALALSPAVEPSATTQCKPTVTANLVANVRSGPGTGYDIVGGLPTGASAPVAGRDATSAWWYIQFAGGYGGYAWIAASVVTPACIPALVQEVAAPPLPTEPPAPAPSKTPKGPQMYQLQPYLFLEIKPTATSKFLQVYPHLQVTMIIHP